MPEVQIGQVTHFYHKIGVAVFNLTDKIQVGDTLRIRGHSTDFQQAVMSLQIEHQSVDAAGPGEVAMKVEQRVHLGDAVFKIMI